MISHPYIRGQQVWLKVGRGSCGPYKVLDATWPPMTLVQIGDKCAPRWRKTSSCLPSKKQKLSEIRIQQRNQRDAKWMVKLTHPMTAVEFASAVGVVSWRFTGMIPRLHWEHKIKPCGWLGHQQLWERA